MTLSEIQKKHLRSRGHQLKPVVTVGNAGLSDALLDEFEIQLAHHELLKVRIQGADREARDAAIENLCRTASAELVARIGNVALLWRRNEENPRVDLPRR